MANTGNNICNSDTVILTLVPASCPGPAVQKKNGMKKQKKKKKRLRISACEMTLLNEVSNHCELIYLAVH